MKVTALVSFVLAAMAPFAVAAPTGLDPNCTEPAVAARDATHVAGARHEHPARGLKASSFVFRRDAKTGDREERSFANGIRAFNGTAF